MLSLVHRLLGRGTAAPAAAEDPPPAVRPALDGLDAVPVFFDPRMSAAVPGEFRGPRKSARVMASWRALGVPLDVRGFAPATPEQLSEIHEPGHVRGVLAGEEYNGHNNKSVEAAAAELWKCGAMAAAAEFAARQRAVAAVPATGFHHAHWRTSMDYCTFNAHLLAAKRLLDGGLATGVAIVDLDRHWGDGTADILRRVRIGPVEHYSFACQKVTGPEDADRWLDRLADDIAAMAARGCSFVIFNAGVDPHVDDPMGGFLTDAQMERRDRTVFATCRTLGLPVAWALGGGYRRPYSLVLDSHDATLRACAEAFGVPPAAPPRPRDDGDGAVTPG